MLVTPIPLHQTTTTIALMLKYKGILNITFQSPTFYRAVGSGGTAQQAHQFSPTNYKFFGKKKLDEKLRPQQIPTTAMKGNKTKKTAATKQQQHSSKLIN